MSEMNDSSWLWQLFLAAGCFGYAWGKAYNWSLRNDDERDHRSDVSGRGLGHSRDDSSELLHRRIDGTEQARHDGQVTNLDDYRMRRDIREWARRTGFDAVSDKVRK